MLEKTQVRFYGYIGSNDPNITKQRLAQILLETEERINAAGMTGVPIETHCRMHLYIDEAPEQIMSTPSQKRKDENKK